jgi:hypothetical protein
MPLSINVGLSRKASKDYQSNGVSINLTAELDQSLLARPQELQQQIDGLYRQAEHALDRQAGRRGQPPPPKPSADGNGTNGHGEYRGRPSNGHGGGNGSHRSNGNDRNGAGMTASQRRAIESMARRLNVEPEVESREMIGAEFDNLSIRQASELIDHLKSLQSTCNGRNGGGR